MSHIGRRNFDDSDEDDEAPSFMAGSSLKAAGLKCQRCGRHDFSSVPQLSAHATRCRGDGDMRRPKKAVFVARDQMAHDRFGLLLHMKKAEMAEEAKSKENGGGGGQGAVSAFGRKTAYWEQQSAQAKAVINKPLSKTVEQALENARLKRIADKVRGSVGLCLGRWAPPRHRRVQWLPPPCHRPVLSQTGVCGDLRACGLTSGARVVAAVGA